MLVICRSGFCFLLMFRSTFLLLTCRDCHFHIQQKVFLLASDMSSQKRKAYETDDEFEDSSDFKCVSASYCLWKKSGPASASVKQHYQKEYRDTWPFLGPSTKGKHHVFCQLCKNDFLRRQWPVWLPKAPEITISQEHCRASRDVGYCEGLFQQSKTDRMQRQLQTASYYGRGQNVWDDGRAESAACNSQFPHRPVLWDVSWFADSERFVGFFHQSELFSSFFLLFSGYNKKIFYIIHDTHKVYE